MALVGFPDPNILADDMASCGFWSCSSAEQAGWYVTWHKPTREAVDKLLTQKLNIELDEIVKRLEEKKRGVMTCLEL